MNEEKPRESIKRSVSDTALFHKAYKYPEISNSDILSSQQIGETMEVMNKEITDKIRIQESKDSATELDLLKETEEKIDNAKLAEEYVNDEAQKELLKIKKEAVKKMIMNVIKKINDYVEAVNANVLTQRNMSSFADQAKFKEALIASDQARFLAHNALLDNLRSTARNISYNFGHISEGALAEWQDKLADKGQMYLHVSRQDFPKNVICPDYVDLADRHLVAEWAGKLQQALTADLPKNLQ